MTLHKARMHQQKPKPSAHQPVLIPSHLSHHPKPPRTLCQNNNVAGCSLPLLNSHCPAAAHALLLQPNLPAAGLTQPAQQKTTSALCKAGAEPTAGLSQRSARPRKSPVLLQLHQHHAGAAKERLQTAVSYLCSLLCKWSPLQLINPACWLHIHKFYRQDGDMFYKQFNCSLVVIGKTSLLAFTEKGSLHLRLQPLQNIGAFI